MRQNYVDNLRNATILLLFPVHTFMIWNDFGQGFYIWLGANKILSTLIVLVNPWFMPILFALAGISARYALEKKTNREFIIQRISKLLVPFVSGMVFLIPFQTLYARKFFDNYDGGIWSNWKYFFTHLTDFSGYDGAFTPGHLWFVLFLLLTSLVALVLFRFLSYQKFALVAEKIPAIGVLFLFIPIWLMHYLGNIGGFSIGKNLALYLSGYYVLSNDHVVDKLEKNMKWLTGLCIIGTIVLVTLYYSYSYYGDLWINYIGWNTILVLMVLGRKFFNKRTRFTEYFNKASYPIYILHQTVLVVFAYYVVQLCDRTIVQVVGICFGSFLLTVMAYHIIGVIPILRKLIGVK